jgi:hypothetical protein
MAEEPESCEAPVWGALVRGGLLHVVSVAQERGGSFVGVSVAQEPAGLFAGAWERLAV